MERKYKGKSVDGVVISVEERTAGDHRIATLRVRDSNDKIWQCLFWNEDCNAIIAQEIHGRRIYIEGGLKGDNEVSVKYFNTDFANKPRGVEQSDPEAFKEYLERHNRVMVVNMRDGRALKYSQHKHYCVKVNGQWEAKIEYCCRVLGEDVVAEFLRELRCGKIASAILMAQRYRDKLEEMLNHCAAINGDYLEHYEDKQDIDDKKTPVTNGSGGDAVATCSESEDIRADRE
jgi:hypothetical protein